MSSTSLARSLLKTLVRDSITKVPHLQLTIHIDDFAQETRGPRNAVLEDLFNRGLAFARAAEDMGLNISSKSVIQSSCSKLSKGLGRAFKTEGKELNVEVASEHLGFSRVTRASKSFAVLRKRFAKAVKKAKRVQLLSST